MLGLLLMPALALGALATPSESLDGVWTGTLGKQRITACFNDQGSSGVEAAYYYHRHLVPISLEPLNLRRWAERPDDPAPNWNLRAPIGDRVSGQWRAADGGRYLPIELERVRASSPACASGTFNAPIEAAFRLETSTPVAFGKMGSFRALKYLGEASLQLVGEGEGLARINRDLRAHLPLVGGRKREILEQQRSEMGSAYGGMFDETSAEPDFWSPDFITVQFYRWTKGMGRSGISSEYLTWDLASGRQVDPWAWVGASGSEMGEGVLPPKLARFEKRAAAGADCDQYRGKGHWFLSLEKSGMRFWEDAWGEGECERDFFVPYDQLEPYLTAEGKRAVARLRARPGFRNH